MKQKLVYSVLACIFLILLMTVSCTTGGKHTHSWTEWNDVKNASCSSNGLRERECISCGKNETEIIASAGHQFSEWVVKDNGSCMNAGYKERSCSVCHETEQQEIAPTGHAYGDFEQILLPTCTEEGNKQKVCSICNDVVQEPIPATGHTYAGNQCTQCNHLIESSGLEFSSNGDGTCLIIGPGSCNDAHLIIPSHSPRGDKVIGIADGTSLVGDGVFTNCDDILSVTFPDTMEMIGEEAFSGCDGLTSIHIPASITSINHSAFMECENLTTLTVDPNNTVYHSAGNCIIETARKMIAVGAKNSVIPNDGSVTEIGFYSFYGRDVKEIFVPDGITTIGYMAFYGCTNLRKMILPDSVKGIQPYAFCYCYNLTSVTVGSGLEYIHSDAFSSCDKLVEVINNSNFNIVAGSEENEKIAYYALFVHNGETKIENWRNYLFITCSGKNYLLGYVGDNTTLNLPASYNGQGYEIYKYAFYGNKNIVSITIPETVSKIGDWAFRGCSSLVTVNYLGTDIQWNEIIPENNRLGISSDIVKYASEHTHIAVVDPAVAPSCTKTGLTEGAHCLICNEVLWEQTVVPVAGHSYGDWHEVPANACAGGTYSIRVCTTCFDVEYSDEYTGILHPHDFEMELNSPTCTESGDVQIVCRKCGVIGAQETLSPLGHNLGWEANAEGHYLACRRDNCDHKTSLETHTMAETSLCVDASCTVCGYFMREGLGHIWGNEYQSDENGHWYVCTRDDCHQTTFYGKHQHADAICTDTSANCDICGKEFVPDGNHGMGEWQQTKAPTCTENGERRRDC